MARLLMACLPPNRQHPLPDTKPLSLSTIPMCLLGCQRSEALPAAGRLPAVRLHISQQCEGGTVAGLRRHLRHQLVGRLQVLSRHRPVSLQVGVHPQLELRGEVDCDVLAKGNQVVILLKHFHQVSGTVIKICSSIISRALVVALAAEQLVLQTVVSVDANGHLGALHSDHIQAAALRLSFHRHKVEKILRHEQWCAVLPRGRLQTGGHVHVRRQVGCVDLLQGAHSALNAPSRVQTEAHGHLVVGGAVVGQAGLGAIGQDLLGAVELRHDLEVGDDGHICHGVHSRDTAQVDRMGLALLRHTIHHRLSVSTRIGAQDVLEGVLITNSPHDQKCIS
mmetsp:Transcript_9047/g.15298  ORF Transcript_9047/g.15298 Transcript_9047/m.15298 type:complete len:336 (+) Transcript_9047:154-1161(+)